MRALRILAFSTVGPQPRLPPTCDIVFTQPSVLNVLLDKSWDHGPPADFWTLSTPSFYKTKEQKTPRAPGPRDSGSQGTYHPGGPAPGTHAWGEVTRGPEGTQQDPPAPPRLSPASAGRTRSLGSEGALPPGPSPRNSTRRHAAPLSAAPKGRSAPLHADSRTAPRFPPCTWCELALNSEGRRMWTPELVFCMSVFRR